MAIEFHDVNDNDGRTIGTVRLLVNRSWVVRTRRGRRIAWRRRGWIAETVRGERALRRTRRGAERWLREVVASRG